MDDNPVRGAVHAATDSRAFEYAARAGYSTSGVLHILLAYLILRLAVGLRGAADPSGAFATLAAHRGGAVALWGTAVGLVALALWRAAEAVVGSHPTEPGREHHGVSDAFERVKAVGLALIYAGLAVSAIRFTTGATKSSSEQNTGLTARLLQSGWGRAVLLIAAAVIVGVGGYHVYKGVSQKFQEDLTVRGGRLVRRLGQIGYTAKGVVLAATGILLAVATLTTDPAKGAGLDAAIKSLGHAPFGRVLLVAAAAGFAAYGLYSFVMVRFSRM